MGKLSISVLSVLLLISVFWKPTFAADKCSLGCTGSPTTQSFLNGHKYNYGVEGVVSIYLTGASKQETSVKVLGQVSVSSVGNCVHELAVQNLVISGPDGKKYQSPPGIEKPIRFTLQDGRTGPEICAVEGDTRRSLNIKRALISLLQTEQKPSTQVDVFGTCPTDVSSSQEGSAVLVHRSRDLSRCGHREQSKNDLVTGVFNPSADIKDTQILQSSMNVETKVNNGVPEKVAATEEYLYRPFSVGENGARAKVYTKLTLTGKARAANNPTHCTETRTIIFENPHGVTMNQNNMQSALNAVKETAKSVATEASSKSAGNFAQLVRILRTSNKNDLMAVYSHIKGNNVEKRVFLDGLLRAGTGYSIEASIQLLKSKELGPLEQRLVFLSLSNARHANNDALKAAAGLLDLPNIPREVYLGVGALAGAYCREHECHRTRNDGIVALSNKLAAKLQFCRPKTKVEEDNVVAVLKGIRNIRHLEDSLVDKLVKCAQDVNVKSRVKAAALEAFQADPCSAKLKKAAIDLMKNRQLDSEIRIKAYLAIISCPCAQSATEIKNLLDTEPVHQVGNFISTSLRNIRASSNHDKQLARQHYGLIRTPSKFNNDYRKYSYYEEESFDIDALGIGGSLEKTVIFSQDSFLPRSVDFNLTAEVFGRSLNVLEVGGRQGNLDRVVEHLLGPKSFLRTEEPQSLYKKYVLDKFNQYKEKVEGGLHRGRRSLKTDVDNFDKTLKAEATPFNNELDFDLYVKLFGTDAVFLSLGDDKGFDFDKVVDQFMQYLNKGINDVKHFQQEVRAHMLFLDAELAYPTSTGLPLKLDVVGAATGRLEVATNVDIRQCLNSPKDAKVDIKVVPSTDVEITGALLVDADAISTGLKVIVNLHSSTGGHVIAKVLENGRGFDLQVGLPVDKQEIITASNDLVYFSAEKGQPEKQNPVKMDNVVKENVGCFDQAADFLGLTVCGEMTVPFTVSGPDAQASINKYLSSYPLAGKTKFRVMLEKQNLRGYHIKGVLRSDEAAGRESFELLFDAEGAKYGRAQLNGEYVNNKNEIGAQVSLNSPLKVASAQATFYRKPTELSVVVKGKYDDNELYGKVGFNVQGGGNRKVYKPVAEFQMPGEKDKHKIPVSGQVVEEVGGGKTKYSIENVKLSLPSVKEPICIDGHVTTAEKDIEFDTTVKDLASLKGSVKKNDVTLEFQNKLNPYVNFRLKGHFEYEPVLRNEFDLVYGGDLRNNNNRVVFEQMLKYHKNSPEDFNVITKNKFEILALPFKVRFDADVDPKKVDVELEGQYQDKKADFDLEARQQIKKPGDYSMKLKAVVDKNGLEVFSKRDIVSADKSNLENYIEFKNVGRYELSGVLLHKTKPNDMNVGAIGHLKASVGGKTQDIKFDVGAIQTATLYSSHAKVSDNGGDILDFLLKTTRGPNANGQLKLIVKNAISANGQFKVTDSDGKGNGMFIVDFKQSQRKIKADVKFVAKAPTYGAEIDVFLNYEKDNNDRFHLSTNTKRTDKLLDTKNKLTYAGKKFEVNVHQDGVYGPTGKTHGVVELVLPTERCLTFKLDRDITQAGDKYNGHAELLLSDAAKRGGAASTIAYKGKVTNTNFENEIINYEGQLEVKLKDGKHLLNTFSLKNNPEGADKFKFELKYDVTGNLLPKPANLDVTYSYYDSLVTRDDKYRIKGSFGDDTNFEWAGIWEVKFLEGDKKYLDDFVMTIRLPFEKAHDIKYINTVLYLQPENKDTVEFTVVESVQVNADVYKIDASGKVSPQTGLTTVKVLLPHVDPVVLEANYKTAQNGDKSDNHVEVKAKYGKGKSAVVSVDAEVAPRDNKLCIKANAPGAEALKKLEFTVHSKNPSADTYSSSMLVDADGRVYKSESLFVFSKAHPLVDVKYSSPSTPKPSRLFFKGTTLSSTQGKLEVKIENVRDVSFDCVTEGNIQKDNVQFKMTANSDKLGMKNYQVEIASKDAGNGKRLEFHAVNDGKNVLSGSTSYISKQEGPKMIIEGSGAVKVKEEQKSANFKYIRTILGDGNEKGVETFFNMAIGERSYVAESRVTNLEYKNSYVYCEEKKQCAHAEFNSKIDLSKPGVITNLVNAGFDLRKLGIAPEFGLQIKDEVSDQRLPQYTLDLHVNKDDKKYHLHVYNTPEFGYAKSGITVQLPQRLIALESVASYPTNKALPFPVRGDVSFDMDKNKQGHKTSARFLVDLEVSNDKQQSAVAEFGFNHPKLNKEAVVKVRGNLQRPQQNSVKLETSASISCSVLGADREAKLLVEGSPTHLKVLMNTPLVKVLDVEGSATVNEQLQKGEMKVCLLEGKPVRVSALAKDYQYFEFSTEESDRKLSVVGHLQPEKRVDVSADIILGGTKKNLLHGALYLDDNLVKSDYGASKDNLNYFLAALRKDLDNLEGRIKQLGEKANNDFKAVLQRVEPTFKNIEKAYAEDFEKFYKEIADDKALKEISEALAIIVQSLAKMLDAVVTGTKPIVDSIVNTYVNVAKQVQQLYEKSFEPVIKQFYETLAKYFKEILDAVLDVVAHYTALVSDFYEKHKPELEELTNTLTAIFKDLTRLLVAQLKEFRARFDALAKELTTTVKELPLFAVIKEKFGELAVPEQAAALLNDAYVPMRALLPTNELRDFTDALHAYVTKKLKQEKVDDNKELRALYQKLSTAITSLIQFVRAQLGQVGLAVSPAGFNPASFAPGSVSAPTFGSVPSASLLSRLLTGDAPDVLAFVRAYRPRSLNPLDEVPTKLRAVIVNGQHIFTFDGRHLTFPGNCRYVLAHDHVDRNFTLLIQLVNGQPKALVLEDKSGTIVELKDNGQVTLNGAAHGFPVMEKDTFAYREASGRIGLGTTYGAKAICSTKLEVCYIEVNGFYLGKLRGLLGDGNNEPYDDFRLPNGKICTSESEFGNAYRLARSCPEVKTPEHNHHQMHHMALPPACEEVFGGASPLRPLGLFLDLAPFRQACIHACSGDSAQALHQACDLARGYAALALSGLLPAVLPEVCVQCTDADKPRKVGESYELKVPNKQADIIVAFETTVGNEKNYKNLVVPLVGQVLDALKSKRITDVKVYLVGMTPKFPYPIIYDSDLRLKTPKPTFPDANRYSSRPPTPPGKEPVCAYVTELVNIIETLRIQFGLTNVAAGYSSLLELPLRAGAVKHTINVVGDQCFSQFFLLEVARAATFSVAFDNMAYSHSLVTVTPPGTLSIGNGKNAAQIVGYTEDAVIMLGDRTVGKEAEALRSSLTATPDACRDFIEMTDGVVFSGTNFHALDAGKQKLFLQTAAAAITARMTHESAVQDCTCVYADPFRVRSACVSKDKKEVARRRK
ncbi:hypothetical protein PYW08_010569 [Mythimna loreyi]|uniref:Uncharacterized protein n=1 Tax=Mythimna loreyi TaxID=667449 RepID=A0ACC2Q3E5_9NEOP|nr:hypothetical protein PYW08_010569 [Mythimna loreyi]